MGTWGHTAFDSDTALDWFENDLRSSDDYSALEDAIDAIESVDDDDYLDEEELTVAIAAAEVIAALRGRPATNLNPIVAEWVSSNSIEVPPSLIGAAFRSVARAEANSELRGLWGEREKPGKWRLYLAELQKRLAP